MVNFYVKNDTGEFVEPSEDQIDEFYKQKSDRIIAKKLEKEREKYRAKLDGELRKEVSETIKAETRQELESEYKTKVQEAEAKVQGLEIRLRRKTIAAEYGFSPEIEEFLGDGNEEEMHAKADALKNNFGQNEPSNKQMEKNSSEPVNTGCVRLCS